MIARFDDGSPALVEGRRGKGRVLIWATGLDRFWNNLPLQPVYLPFVHRLTRFLGGRGEVPPWHLAVAANVDVTESDLARMDIEEFLGAVGGEPVAGEAAVDPTPADASATEIQAEDFEGRQSFWRYLLAAVFLLMVSETVLANRLSRRRSME